MKVNVLNLQSGDIIVLEFAGNDKEIVEVYSVYPIDYRQRDSKDVELDYLDCNLDQIYRHITTKDKEFELIAGPSYNIIQWNRDRENKRNFQKMLDEYKRPNTCVCGNTPAAYKLPDGSQYCKICIDERKEFLKNIEEIT